MTKAEQNYQADYERRILGALSDAPPRQVTPQEAAKARIPEAIDTLIEVMAPNPHDGCACMGPREGHDMCPCLEKGIARKYLAEWRKLFPARALANGGDSDG